MAVLVEGISVIVRRDSVVARYSGGWDQFVADAPNRTFCADSDLARIGFMAPDDVAAFIDFLQKRGLVFLEDGRAVDFCVCDQQSGPTCGCSWVEFGQIEFDNYRVAAARLAGSTSLDLHTPDSWSYENSLSRQFSFIPTGEESKSLRYLRHENGTDVYLNLLTGKEVYIGRWGARQ